MPLSADVAAEIRRLMTERGWSGRELARRTGMPVPTLARKLSGQHPFDLDDIPVVAQAFGLDPRDFLSQFPLK